MADLGIYIETLIYAYEHPRHKTAVKGADVISVHEENISCGDKIDVHLKIEDGKVAKAGFSGTGCIISMGSADILLDSIEGKALSQVESMGVNDLLKLINISPGPARMHCATLALRAVREAALRYEGLPVDAYTKEL